LSGLRYLLSEEVAGQEASGRAVAKKIQVNIIDIINIIVNIISSLLFKVYKPQHFPAN
jgi:hypothetical protein